MIRAELYKLFKRKLVWEVFAGVFALMIVSEIYLNSYYLYGGHYRELQDEIALHEKYRGELTDERLYAFLTERWGSFYEKYPEETYDYMDSFCDEEGNELRVGVGAVSVDSVFPETGFPVQFGYYQGWALFLDQLPRYLKYLSIFVAVAFASLFSYERDCGMQEILFCTKRGREDCIRAKVAGAFLVTNISYLVMVLLPCITAFILYQGKGLGTSIQMTPWIRDSQLDMSYGKLLLHTIFLSLVTINVILLLSLTAAFVVKNPTKAVCITLAVLFLLRPDIVSGYLQSAVMDRITAMTPVNVMDTLNLAKQTPLDINGVKLQWLTMAEIFYSVALVWGGAFFFWQLPKKGGDGE